MELQIKSKLIDQGFFVSDPILSTSYDFITDWDGIINTIQVRSTRSKDRNGYYRVEVPNVGGYHILIIHIVPTDATYLIPWDEVDRNWICISSRKQQNRYEKFKDKWDILKEAH